MTISKKGVSSRDPFDLIKLSYALNKEKLRKEFDKLKIKVDSEKDLASLATIVKEKLDVSGKIKDGEKVIMFDTMRIINSIKYTEKEKKSVLDKTSLFVE